jgi:hypothetical protein
MALHVSGVCAHRQEIQDLKLPHMVFCVACVERRREPRCCETWSRCGVRSGAAVVREVEPLWCEKWSRCGVRRGAAVV